MSWRSSPHVCEIPLSVYHRPNKTDIWECDHCHAQWALKSIKKGDQNTYGRFILTFVPILMPGYKNAE